MGVAFAAQLPRKPAACPEGQFAVPGRQFDHPLDLAHARGNRQRPGRGQHIDARPGRLLLEQFEQGVGHDQVAHPAGCGNQHPGGIHALVSSQAR